MKTMWRIILLAAVMAATGTYARAGSLGADSLKGLTGGVYVVASFDSQGSTNIFGLNVDQIRADVEIRLTKAGIPVLDAANDKGILLVSVRVVASANVGFSYSVDMSFIQPTVIVATRQVSLTTVTWMTQPFLGSAGGAPRAYLDIRKSLADQTENFIKDYQAAKPKPATAKKAGPQPRKAEAPKPAKAPEEK